MSFTPPVVFQPGQPQFSANLNETVEALAGHTDASLADVSGFLDINIREYAPSINFNGGSDSTAAHNAASLALNALAVSRGQVVRVWGYAGAHLLIDGLRSYEFLRWEMEDATFTKTNGVNPMFYTSLSTTARTFTTTFATGRTVASSNTIHDVEIPRPTGVNADRPGTLAVGGAISGAGIPAAATITAIDAANREVTISSNATATASGVALSHNPSFGTISSGQPTVTAISTPRAWVVGRTVTGTGIPGGTTITAIDWTDPNAPVVTLSANATASGATNLAVAGLTYFGRGRSITLNGGVWDPNGFAMNGAIIYPKYVERFRMSNVTRLHNWGSAAPTWGLDVLGYDAVFRENRVEGGDEIHQDGNHVTGGEYVTFLGEYVESGDDAFALCTVPGSTFAAVDPRPIAHVTGSGNIGRSAKGYLFRASVEADNTGTPGFFGPNFAVSDISLGVTGSAGKYRNGGIGIFDENAVAGVHPEASRRLLSRINVTADVDVGSTYHDGTNPYAVYVRGANDVQIDATVNVVGEGAAAIERRRVREADRVDITLRGTGGTAANFSPRETRRLVINEPHVSVRRQRSRLDEDFIGAPNAGTTTLSSGLTTGGAITSLPVAALPVALSNGTTVTVHSGSLSQVWTLGADATLGATSITVASQTPAFAAASGSFVVPAHAATLPSPWIARRGSNAGCSVLYLPDAQDGVLRLVPGVSGSSTMATDGVQVDAASLAWRALDGGLVIEARVRLSQFNGVAAFVGFANQRSSLQIPAAISATTPVTNQSTMCGVIYDSTSTGAKWWGVGAQSSTAAGQDLGLSPTIGVNATWATWRVEIDTDGTALFELDGVAIGTRQVNALIPTTPVTPYIGALGRSTGLARGALDVSYVTVDRLRG